MRFRPRLLTFGGGLILLWQIIRNILDFVGYVDLVIDHSKHPGWLVEVATWLLNPPRWITLPAVLLGLALIYFDLQQGKVKPLSSMRFVYPNRAANLASKSTLYHESYMWVPDGEAIKTPITSHIYYVGVENLTDRTLRNVRLVLESVSIPPHPIDIQCRAKRTGQSVIDIQPKSTELFFFGEGYDAEDGAGIIIRQQPELEKMAEFVSVTPFNLGSSIGGSIPLLKNDGYVIGFSAYADDTVSISAEAVLSTRERIELRLMESPIVFQPDAPSD